VLRKYRGSGIVFHTIRKFPKEAGQGSRFGGKPKTGPLVRSAVDASQRSGKVVKTARRVNPA
jgi:hypothetical protein